MSGKVEFYRHQLGDEEAASWRGVLETLFLTLGPQVAELEKELGAFLLGLTGDAAKVAGQVFNVGSDAGNVQILNLAFRVRDAVPGTEVVHAPTDPDLRDYNVSFEKAQRVLGFEARHPVDDGIREVLGALRDGLVDPEERKHYTMRQYVFLREAERAHRELSIEGKLLSDGPSGAPTAGDRARPASGTSGI